MDEKGAKEQLKALQPLQLPIGWTDNASAIDCKKGDAGACGRFLQRCLGWLITIFAVSLGAPFWFDLLGKFISLRATVKPKEEAPASGADSTAAPAVPAAPSAAASVGPVGSTGAAVPSFVPHRWMEGDPQGGVL